MFPGEGQAFSLTLYTDAYVIRGQVMSRQRRVTDVLNSAEHEFLVLTDVLLDEYGTRSMAVKADYAQVNLAAVLFAQADVALDPLPELTTPKIPEQALISIPPFKIVGRIHLAPQMDLRSALLELTGRFVPVTEAAFWSETLGEARTTVPMLAFNHSRAQILAPHRVVDPWEGLPQPDAGTAAAGPGSPGPGKDPKTGVVDPWGRRD